MNFIPVYARQRLKDSLVEKVYEGYYGNPIVLLVLRIRDGRIARDVFCNIISRLTESNLKLISSELEHRLDKSGNLYLRFDKQSAYRGEFELYDGDDVVKVKVKLSVEARRKIRGNDGLTNLLGICNEA